MKKTVIYYYSLFLKTSGYDSDKLLAHFVERKIHFAVSNHPFMSAFSFFLLFRFTPNHSDTMRCTVVLFMPVGIEMKWKKNISFCCFDVEHVLHRYFVWMVPISLPAYLRIHFRFRFGKIAWNNETLKCDISIPMTSFRIVLISYDDCVRNWNLQSYQWTNRAGMSFYKEKNSKKVL